MLQDLIKYTPASHPDHAMLTEALNMTQHFLDEFNIIQTKSMFPVSHNFVIIIIMVQLEKEDYFICYFLFLECR